MKDFELFGYKSEEEFLEDILGCNDNYTLDDFFESYETD